MKIIHQFQRISTEKKVAKDTDHSFLLTNRNGSYAYFSKYPKSRYEGFYFYHDGKEYKTLENVEINGKKVTELKNSFFSFERKRSSLTESFFVPHMKNSLVYELNKSSKISLSFDCKESYDNKEWGRNYHIHTEKGCTIITFTKTTDSREDSSHGQMEYCYFIAIKSDAKNIKERNDWVFREYESDSNRKSEPFTRYVYNCLELKGKEFVLSASFDKQQAISECLAVYKGASKLKGEQKKYISDLVKKSKIDVSKIKDNETKMACISSMVSLDGLTVNKGKSSGVLAGLPWFYQVWSRDELISLKGFILLKKYDFAFDAIKRQLTLVKGTALSNNDSLSYPAADAVGWLFVRLDELSKKSSSAVKPLLPWIKKVGNSILKDQRKYQLVLSGPKETWMDSLERSGARIEIQSLRLASLHSLHSITKDGQYQTAEKQLKKNVLNSFFHNGFLYDGMNDSTIRPNLFISYYVYSSLLSKEEWKECFDRVLKKLITEKGLISTIDISHHDHNEYHTGEIPVSYHNGDSWYYINNLIGICLHRVDSRHFKKDISSILSVSTDEILWKGAIGHHAEISSSSKAESQGCLQQAWSCALYLELIDELFS